MGALLGIIAIASLMMFVMFFGLPWLDRAQQIR